MTVTKFLSDAIKHINCYGEQIAPGVNYHSETSDWDAICILTHARAEVSRINRNAARRALHAAYTDLGMVRVRGSLGGVYYE